MYTSEKASRARRRWLLALATLVDSISSMWFGYCQGVFAGVLVSPDFRTLFPQTNEASISGIVTSCFLLGAFFGAVFAFIIGDKLGRKKTLAMGHALNFVGALLQTLSWSLPQMVVGRIVNGFGIGITSTTSPVYLAECVPSRLRGRLLAIGASSNVSSFCLANWISYSLYNRTDSLQWRLPLGLQLVFACIVCPAIFFTPESPRWLLIAGRNKEALEVVARFAGTTAQDEIALNEYKSIMGALDVEQSAKRPAGIQPERLHHMRRLLLSCGTQLMQQFSGINALGFYLPTLLQKNVGYDSQMARLLTAVNGTVYWFSVFGSLFVIDHVGRRRLMLVGSVLTGICHLIASMALKAGEDEANMQMMGKLAVAMFMLYHVFFGCTWGAVPWVYSAEINSLTWRTRGAAAATATNWITGFAVVQFTKVGIDNLGWAFYLIFAVISLCYLPITFLFYPETSQRTLEDMDVMFARNSSIFVCGKDEMTSCRRPQALVDAEVERTERGNILEREQQELVQESSDASGTPSEKSRFQVITRGVLGPEDNA